MISIEFHEMPVLFCADSRENVCTLLSYYAQTPTPSLSLQSSLGHHPSVCMRVCVRACMCSMGIFVNLCVSIGDARERGC